MLQSLRNNRMLLKNKRGAFDKHPAKENKPHKKLKFKQVPKEQTEEFLEKFKAEKRREKYFRTFLWGTGVIFIGLVIYIISN